MAFAVFFTFTDIEQRPVLPTFDTVLHLINRHFGDDLTRFFHEFFIGFRHTILIFISWRAAPHEAATKSTLAGLRLCNSPTFGPSKNPSPPWQGCANDSSALLSFQ